MNKSEQEMITIALVAFGLYYAHIKGYINLNDVLNKIKQFIGGTGGSGGGTTDEGVTWFHGTGSTTSIPQSRTDAGDFRWSQNFDDVSGGYEATVYARIGTIASGAHIGLKHWGPNHKQPCSNEEQCVNFDGPGGKCCCCWYDTGIREDGQSYMQIERPHNDNWDVDCPNCQKYSPMDQAAGVGVKWAVFPEGGGIHIKMWVDPDGFPNDTPANNWQLVYDIVDTGQILPDYTAPPDQEIEMRISDSDNVECFGGGLLVKMIGASSSRAKASVRRIVAHEFNDVIYSRVTSVRGW